MEQLTQNLKDGNMQILEVPFPALNAGQILVRNHFSLISAGTEGKTVKDARLGYFGKARARKEEVKKVIQTAKTMGIMETYRLVMNKLDAPSALGYSCAGEVIDVAADVRDFKPGDLVACGGSGAVHAEVVAIPVNLCVKLDDGIDMRMAAFTTVGAIAMQGIRQADLRLAENCVVIGLGLIGQLTVLLLKAAGVKVIAIDIDKAQVQKAKSLGADFSADRNDAALNDIVSNATHGFGVDAVIITASSSSNDPIELAGELCRRKGKVIIVGAVPTGFSRKNYYVKELDLRMSCSYGPGRYDAEYEEQGVDYPYAYVRWTENRNMQAFAELISNGKLNLESIISHEFKFQEATKAYDLIIAKSEPFAGIVLKYDLNKALHRKVVFTEQTAVSEKPSIAFIGAGSFAQNMLLPKLKTLDVNFVGVTTARANNALNISKKYNFNYCTDNANEIFTDKNINTVFITTRHDSHYQYVLDGINNNKHVFVEKPLCMNEEELEIIKENFSSSKSYLMVGFNRRFAPLIQNVKKHLNSSVPVAINYRINAGVVAADHWTQNPKIGGGRIIGEVCHFIDLCRFIAGASITYVSAIAMKSASNTEDTVCIQLQFENGSVATINYFANGPKELPKEQIEVFASGSSYIINDFKILTIYNKSKKVISSNQDKGHSTELVEFVNAIKNGTKTPIPFQEIYESMLTTFKSIYSLRNNGLLVPLKK
jgi:polar amino acid transport system substrate-binding protein